MSRVGRQPVQIPEKVTVSVASGKVTVKGPLGELSMEIGDHLAAEVRDGTVIVTRDGDAWEIKSRHGLARSLIKNMMEGVSKGYSKQLEIQGVGFKAEVRGQTLSLSLGFSGPKEFAIPQGVQVAVEGGTALKVSGIDKVLVGDVAARIRSFYPAEPYKGKGVRYKGEYVRRKVGKTVA